MLKWIEIPHGVFQVRIDDPDLWRSIKLEFMFRKLPWQEKDAVQDMGSSISAIDFYLIASTCPCPRHMLELTSAMGLDDDLGLGDGPEGEFPLSF